MDMAAGPDSTAYCWILNSPSGDGTFVHVPLPWYIPVAWRDKITPVWGPDRDGNLRWHLLKAGWNNGEGHAKARVSGKAVYCHRHVVELVEGRKLDRFNYVDHRCERKSCLTYECLEAVYPGVNTLRGPGRHTQFKPVEPPPAGYACLGTNVQELTPEEFAKRYPATYGDPLDAL